MSNFINAILAFVELETRRLKYNRTELYTRLFSQYFGLLSLAP